MTLIQQNVTAKGETISNTDVSDSNVPNIQSPADVYKLFSPASILKNSCTDRNSLPSSQSIDPKLPQQAKDGFDHITSIANSGDCHSQHVTSSAKKVILKHILSILLPDKTKKRYASIENSSSNIKVPQFLSCAC